VETCYVAQLRHKWDRTEIFIGRQPRQPVPMAPASALPQGGHREQTPRHDTDSVPRAGHAAARRHRSVGRLGNRPVSAFSACKRQLLKWSPRAVLIPSAG